MSLIVGISYNKKLKTLWQKKKLLVLSNFSFWHDVFKSRLLQMRENAPLGGKGLNILNNDESSHVIWLDLLALC